MAKWIISQPGQPAPDQSESFLGQAKRVGIGTGIRSLEGIEGLQNLLTSLVGSTPQGDVRTRGQERQEGPSFSEQLKQKYELTPEYLEPQNALENFIQRFGSSAPLAALGGIPGLAASAVGSGAASAAGALDVPGDIQDIIQLGSEIGYGALGSKLLPKSVAKPIPSLNTARKLEYDLAKVPESVKVNAKAIINPLREVENLLTTETNRKVSEEVKHVLETIDKHISKKTINPNSALNLRKSLYQTAKKMPEDKAVQYIQPLTRGINEFFAGYAAQNPEFYKHLSAADKLSSLKHMNLIIPKGLQSLELNKLPGGQATTNILSGILGEGERFFRGLATNSEARKYYFNTIGGILENDPLIVIKNAEQLSSALPEIGEEIQPVKSKWIINTPSPR